MKGLWEEIMSTFDKKPREDAWFTFPDAQTRHTRKRGPYVYASLLACTLLLFSSFIFDLSFGHGPCLWSPDVRGCNPKLTTIEGRAHKILRENPLIGVFLSERS